MKQNAYQIEAKLFFAMAAELRHAYREGGSPEEVAELVDEIDTLSRYTDYQAIRDRCAALLAPPVRSATGTSKAQRRSLELLILSLIGLNHA